MSESPDTSESSPLSSQTCMADSGAGESNALKRRPTRLAAIDGLHARLALA